jgi:hypothetical protein
VAAGECVGEFAGHAFCTERFGAGDAVRVEDERGGPAGSEVRDAAHGVWVLERALEFGAEDGVGLAGFVAAVLADRLLVVVVGPAGALGDHVGVLLGEEVADDRFERVQLAGAWVDEAGAEVVAESEVAVRRFGVAESLGVPAGAVVLPGGAQFVVVEGGAGEERVLAGGLVLVVVGELVVDEVDDECGVDDPDAVCEVLPAMVHEREAPRAGAVAGLGGDLNLERCGLRAGSERVELAVQFAQLAAENGGELLAFGGGEVRSGLFEVLGGVEHYAVVDPYGVSVFVFDEGSVHERAEVVQGLVVWVGAGDPVGDGFGVDLTARPDRTLDRVR